MPQKKEIIVSGYGRRKVYPPAGCCIYCFARGCDLGDEHIIPQALGGNVILREACCNDCGRVIGAKLEGDLTHKTKGMFAAMRLRHGFKSKRPKDQPKSLPFTIVGVNGMRRVVEIPAAKVPRYWITYITLDAPGVIVGRSPREPALGRVHAQYSQEDLGKLVKPGEVILIPGVGQVRDLFRFIAKIAHAMAIAEHGIDAFEPWLPNFILGKDTCTLHYYVAGHENKTTETQGIHRVTLGTWEHNNLLIAATIRLFCRYGFPDYQVAVGKLKEPQK